MILPNTGNVLASFRQTAKIQLYSKRSGQYHQIFNAYEKSFDFPLYLV